MKRPAHGFTLIESLLALVLLSLGLLGAAAMLLLSMQDNADALRSLSARGLASDLAERIRANPHAAPSYDTARNPLAAADCAPAAPCSPAARAAADLAHFVRAAHALLPGADTGASVEYAPATGPAMTSHHVILLRWRDAHSADGDHTVTLDLLAPPVAG